MSTLKKTEEKSTAQSEAEKHIITVKTKAGHPAKYSGNPAEFPGARYETGMAMRRAGVFQGVSSAHQT